MCVCGGHVLARRCRLDSHALSRRHRSLPADYRHIHIRLGRYTIQIRVAQLLIFIDIIICRIRVLCLPVLQTDPAAQAASVIKQPREIPLHIDAQMPVDIRILRNHRHAIVRKDDLGLLQHPARQKALRAQLLIYILFVLLIEILRRILARQREMRLYMHDYLLTLKEPLPDELLHSPDIVISDQRWV